MTTMIKKMARAIVQELNRRAYVADIDDLKRVRIEGVGVDVNEVARAALTAMLEPSEAMVSAGDSSDPGFGNGHANAEQHYEAMIQAALDEKEG